MLLHIYSTRVDRQNMGGSERMLIMVNIFVLPKMTSRGQNKNILTNFKNLLYIITNGTFVNNLNEIGRLVCFLF